MYFRLREVLEKRMTSSRFRTITEYVTHRDNKKKVTNRNRVCHSSNAPLHIAKGSYGSRLIRTFCRSLTEIKMGLDHKEANYGSVKSHNLQTNWLLINYKLLSSTNLKMLLKLRPLFLIWNLKNICASQIFTHQLKDQWICRKERTVFYRSITSN